MKHVLPALMGLMICLSANASSIKHRNCTIHIPINESEYFDSRHERALERKGYDPYFISSAQQEAGFNKGDLTLGMDSYYSYVMREWRSRVRAYRITRAGVIQFHKSGVYGSTRFEAEKKALRKLPRCRKR